MLSRLFLGALLSSAVCTITAREQRRQNDGGAQFTSAANELIASYIPPTAFAIIEADVQAAASSASVLYSDPKSLVYSALEATSIPAWFKSAIPSEYAAQVALLEADISTLRRGIVHPAPPTFIIPITTTDSAGSTYATTITTTSVASNTTITTTSAATAPSSVTTAVNGSATGPITTILTNSAGSTITSGIISGASKVPSTGSSASIPSTSSSTAGGPVPTAVLSGVAAGALGLIGILIAL